MSSTSIPTSAHDIRQATVPPAAAWLGGLGAIPFVALAANTWLSLGVPQADSVRLIVAYGALILSFLGGIQWGLAIGPTGSADWSRLSLSIAPALVGWFALALPPVPALLVLAIAFLVFLAVDRTAHRSGQAPAWYPRLRQPLTALATASLLLTALAVSTLGT